MSCPTIRLANSDDIAVIAGITRAAYAKWVMVIGREPLPMMVDYEAAFRSHRFDLLCEGQAPVGLVETVEQQGWLLIENVCVLPTAQGKGYGRRLVAHAEEFAVARGLDGMRLYTNGLFIDNLRLYASIGYSIDREEPFKGDILVHMSKRLGD